MQLFPCIKCNVLYGHLIKQETGFHYLSYLYCHQKLVAKNTPISLLTCPWECSLRTSQEASIKVPAGAVSSSEGLMDYGRGLLCRDSHDMLRWSASMAMCAHRNHASWCVREKCFGKSLGIDVSIDMQTRVQMWMFTTGTENVSDLYISVLPGAGETHDSQVRKEKKKHLPHI